MTHRIFRWFVVLLGFACAAPGLAADLTLAGFAFAGDARTAPTRFPYSHRVFSEFEARGHSLSREVLKRAEGVANANFGIRPAASLVNLKESDQALMAVLLLTDEIIASENHGEYHKTFVNLRGDLLIFDYKAHAIVRSYPLNTVLFDATPEAPSADRLRDSVETLLADPGEQSLVSLFARRLATAELPRRGTKNLQVKEVVVSPEALALMPAPFRKSARIAERMVADTFSSILSAEAGVPVLPSRSGMVNGVMMMRLENVDDYRLEVPEGDYLFDLKLNGFVKKKTEETEAGVAYVYGVYSSLRFYAPALGTEYLRTDLKNGESAVVPVSQISADDFPGYKDALNGLYRRLSAFFRENELSFSTFFQAEGQPDRDWLRVAASAEDIESRISIAHDIIRSCK